MRINFCEEFYFTYFPRIKFSEFRKKDILPVAVTFSIILKKVFTRQARDLIYTIQEFKLAGIKFLEFRELEFY